MSKSFGNYVGVAEPAARAVRQADEDRRRAASSLRAARRISLAARTAERLAADLAAGRANPMEEKKRLAQDIVARYHDPAAAARAREYFERTVQRREIPSGELDEIELGDCKRVAEVLVKAGFAESRRAAERLISGNAVKIDGDLVRDVQRGCGRCVAPAVLSVGSRRFVRVLAARPARSSVATSVSSRISCWP